MATKDYYKILGLTKNASQDEIKKAYRKLAMKHHPDRNAGDKKSETLFKEINEAHDILGDESKRASYDNGGFNQDFSNGFNRNGFSGFNQNNSDMQFDTDEIFREFFGGRSGFSRQPKSINYDLEYILPVSFEQSILGGEIQINVRRYNFYRTEKEVKVDKIVKVNIPTGINNGVRIKYAGEGNARDDKTRGDLYLEIQVMDSNLYVRKDYDLYLNQDISFVTATLGGEIEIKSITGNVKMKIPEYTSNGKTLRLKGKGIKHLKADTYGDLYVKLNIKVPTSLTNEEKQQLKKLEGILGL